eukprot:47355-Prymnesium_polylepis.1
MLKVVETQREQCEAPGEQCPSCADVEERDERHVDGCGRSQRDWDAVLALRLLWPRVWRQQQPEQADEETCCDGGDAGTVANEQQRQRQREALEDLEQHRRRRRTCAHKK